MKVKEVMHQAPVACSADLNLAAAVHLLWTNDCGALPVLDNGLLEGVITDRDIAIALGTRNVPAGAITVGEVISHERFTCAPDDDVHQALKTMRTHKVRRLPVIGRQGKLEGMLCLNDIVLRAHRVAHKPADVTYDDVVNTLKAIGEHRHGEAEKHTAAMTAAV
ncbi:MAG: CBS domain-containing protein [Bryobacterales bacterium]|nr:CBS domain-containing protein [Bryobacterales bacterium]